MVPNLAPRLAEEITKIQNNNNNQSKFLKLSDAACELGWIGGSILGSLTTSNFYISRFDYDEEGMFFLLWSCYD